MSEQMKDGGAKHYDSAIHLMEVQGGSFVKALAHAYRVADPSNRATLRSAFAGYFDEYELRFCRIRNERVPCADHQRYASDCGGCYHVNAHRSAA